jgi:dephospho-CoA kinase
MVIGLTGNYGMGKSYVLSVFRELGAIVLDSDDIVALLLQEREVIFKIKKILGSSVEREDGTLDKAHVAKLIFNNNELRNKLEVLLHPMVFARVEAYLKKIKRGRQLVIVEVPLLFEGRYQARFDRTITVFSTQKASLERLRKAGVSSRNAMKRLKAQLPARTKKKLADYIIDNSGTKQRTIRQVEKIYDKLIEEMALHER